MPIEGEAIPSPHVRRSLVAASADGTLVRQTDCRGRTNVPACALAHNTTLKGKMSLPLGVPGEAYLFLRLCFFFLH